MKDKTKKRWNDFTLTYWSWWNRTWLKQFIWKIKHRFIPKYQYNKMDTGLKPDYYDLDIRILYAVMNEFKKFYDYNPHSYFTRSCNWDTHPDVLNSDSFSKEWFMLNYDRKKEMDAIYDWWVNYLAITIKHEMFWKSSDSDSGISNAESLKLIQNVSDDEERLENEANEMLIRLMKIRKGLWS